MNSQQVLTAGQHALYMLLLLAAPIVLVVLLVGLIVSVLQAATQINEPTLSFIPKLVAAVVALIVAGPWMIGKLVDYLQGILWSIPSLVG
jgi:flagellar biosynthetic protein FliQ